MTRNEYIDAMFARADAAEAAYRKQHKDDPCKFCGSTQNVKIEPVGGMAKLTALCQSCDEKLVRETARYHAADRHLEAIVRCACR